METVKIELTKKDLIIIQNALFKEPYGEVAETVHNIKNQLNNK